VPELGLFPLPIVLVPTERIPLHIFEPRYIELIGECRRTGADFGLVLATGDGAVHEIGTRARVLEVLDEEPDGTMDIVVEGGERFRLLELTSGRSFTTGLVETVEDDADDEPDPADLAHALTLFERLADTAASDVDVPTADTPDLDFQLAARVDFGADAKQELIAATSRRARVARLLELLEQAIEAVRLERILHERAEGNGKVAPLDPGTAPDEDDSPSA
jgi:ATP-dependent Lon protease